jgi:hypothetical protein
MSRKRAFTLGMIALLVGMGLVARLLPHPPNFVPIAAISLFAGYVFGSRLATIGIPLTSMLVGDLVIGTYDYRVMFVVYAALALPILMAGLLRERAVAIRVVTLTLVSSLIFFATTNLAVWYFGSLYSHDWVGLVECYVAAIPFFKFTLAGDLLWGIVLFGGCAVARRSLGWGVPRLAAQVVSGR